MSRHLQAIHTFINKTYGIYSVLVALSLIIFHNALKCEFVFDDVAAVVKNEDLRPTTSWTKLLEHDFWGTPLSEERSHKSYRPLTVATFKLNYLFSKLSPLPYHAVNIILHVIVCCLYYKLCMLVTDVCHQHDNIEPNTQTKIKQPKLKNSKRKSTKIFHHEELLKPNEKDHGNLVIALVAAILFAVHPVHTEAVTGVVGRAELLSALFYLLAIIIYTKVSFKNNLLSSLFCVIAVACKEQGITVLALCVIYDVFVAHKISVFEFLTLKKKSSLTALLRCLVFLLTAMLIFLWRFTVMKSLPNFAESDIPAAYESFPTKHLTFNYILAINAGLLIYPMNLLCDWSMGTVPLVTEFADPRNMFTLIFWILILFLAFRSCFGTSSADKIILFGTSLMVVSFLPASNLFFHVGFVVAERVLYIPSMGFCLLVATAVVKLWNKRYMKPMIGCFMVVTILSHSMKTILRNEDWLDEYTLFKSGLKVTDRNAKIWKHVGRFLEHDNELEQALYHFQQAVRVQPDDIESYIFMGRALQKLQRYAEAEKAYNTGKELLPKPLAGNPIYIPEISLEIFSHLAKLIKRDSKRLAEADGLYVEALKMRPDYMQAYINRGEILLLMEKPVEAIQCYEDALKQNNSTPYKADLYFNIGVVQSQLKNTSGAMEAYTYAIFHNNDHKMALYNSAVILEGTGDVELLRRAKIRIDRVLKIDPNNTLAMLLLGSIHLGTGNRDEATKAWKELLQIEENSESALFNLAYMHSQAGEIDPCLVYLEQLLTHHPNHDKALLLYGDVMLNHKNNPQAAKMAFTKLSKIDGDNSRAQHNLCVVMVHEGHLEDAEECLSQIIDKYPESKFANQNLAVVRKKLAFKAASEQEKKYMEELSFAENQQEKDEDDAADHERIPQQEYPEEELVYIEPMKKKTKEEESNKEGRQLLKKAKNLLANAKSSIETSKKTDGSLKEKIEVQNKAFVSVKEAIKQLQAIDKQMDETKSRKKNTEITTLEDVEHTKNMEVKKDGKSEEHDPEKRKEELLNWLDELEKQLL